MEKTRLKKGERYWCVNTRDMTAMVNSMLDLYEEYDDEQFCNNNYFHTKEEAEAMAKKIRAVIDGADVIEMPSEEDIENEALENNWIHKERGDCNYPDDLCVESFKDGVNWLKSKIVK